MNLTPGEEKGPPRKYRFASTAGREMPFHPVLSRVSGIIVSPA